MSCSLDPGVEYRLGCRGTKLKFKENKPERVQPISHTIERDQKYKWRPIYVLGSDLKLTNGDRFM